MATRLYLHEYPFISPQMLATFAADWEWNTWQHSRPLRISDGGDDLTLTVSRAGTGAVGDDTANFQLVSDPIPGQLIEGTLTGLVASYTPTAGAAGSLYMVLRVMSPTLTTSRGTLYAGTGGSLPSTALSVAAPSFPSGTALTPVTAEEGDRLVLEIGARKTAGDSSANLYTKTGAITGDTDFSAVGQSATSRTPWIELSQTLWPANAELSGSVISTAGGSGELDVSGDTDAATANIVTAVSAMGGDLDVYVPLEITATVPAVNSAGGDLVDVVSFGEE